MSSQTSQATKKNLNKREKREKNITDILVLINNLIAENVESISTKVSSSIKVSVLKNINKSLDRISKKVINLTKKKAQGTGEKAKKSGESGLMRPCKLLDAHMEFFKKWILPKNKSATFETDHMLSRVATFNAIVNYLKQNNISHPKTSKTVDGKSVEVEERNSYLPDETLQKLLKIGPDQVTRCKFNKYLTNLYEIQPKVEKPKVEKPKKKVEKVEKVVEEPVEEEEEEEVIEKPKKKVEKPKKKVAEVVEEKEPVKPVKVEAKKKTKKLEPEP